ncbi:heterokaryon incompatibility protein-domain-containing protein [Podospora conica]|nr:heterokaryon incompatibility protein-domain-containing protein [Schizothecium conicum]
MDHLHLIILFEAIIVAVVWTTAILAIGVVIQVQRALRDVELVPSQGLGSVAAMLYISLELYVRGMIDDLFRGIGFQPHRASQESDRLYMAVWKVWVGLIGWVPGSGAHWFRVYGWSRMVFGIYDRRQTPHDSRTAIVDPELPNYTYKPLCGPRSIRLITIEHASEGATGSLPPICCSMEEFPLESAPPFMALSYAWDTQEGTLDIACQGARLTVTKNCVAALRSIRFWPSSKETRVWVDAICINQTCVPEKQRQIGMMGDIYLTAASVRVWLGQEDPSSNVVCDYFAKISGDQGEKLRLLPGPIGGSERDPTESGLEMARQWPQLSKSLADFFSRSWFTRAWPIQEVTLPRPGRVYMICGSRRIRLEYIRVGWNLLRELQVLPTSTLHDQPVALQFYLADAIALKRGLVPDLSNRYELVGDLYLDLGKPFLSDLSQFSLPSVMHAMRFKGCRDPKDRFFSLYGVFEELGIDHGIPISMWTQPDANVFRAVALACFKLDGHLGALRFAQQSDPYLRLSDDVLLSARRNPYDGLLSSVFAMSGRVFSVARNLKAGREVCYHAPTSAWQASKSLPSWAPDWTQPIPAHVDTERHISMIDTIAAAGLKVEDTEDAAAVPVVRKGPRIVVEVKVVGRVTDLGTVDSPQLLWQLFSSVWTSSSLPGQHNGAGDTLDPALSALAETISNYVWRSHVAQILVSLRTAFSRLEFYDVVCFGLSAYTSRHPRSLAYELCCNRFPSVASCPTDGAAMRTRLHLREQVKPLFKAGAILVRVCSVHNSGIWHQIAVDISFIVGGLFWDFRLSILETLFAKAYGEIDWVIALPVMGIMIADTLQTITGSGWLGNTPMYLLAWSLGTAAKLGFLITALAWAWRIYLPQLFIDLIVMPRTMRDPMRFLRSLFGASRFRKPGAYTHGVHFFVTDRGVVGSTSSPVRRGDRLAKVRAAPGCMILRPNGQDGGGKSGYVVVGAAYVGTQALLDQALGDESWIRARIC